MTQHDANDLPSTVLRQEHQTILRVIAVLETLVHGDQTSQTFPADTLRQCVTFFQLFADACHHAKEEDLLFPALESCGILKEGGPIGVMLYEHTVARSLVKQMDQALTDFDTQPDQSVDRFKEAALNYIGLLRQHINKEDGILFNMADRVITGQDQRTLCDQFCQVGCQSFGGKTRQQLEQLANDLENHHPTP